MKENGLVISKMTWGIWQIFTGWKIEISFEKEMAELNQNKNSRQLHWPDVVSKLCFTLEINE